MSDSDQHLDDALRQVPLPDTLRAALGPEDLFRDAALDRLLRAVPVPAGLGERVRATTRGRVAAATRPAGVIDLSRFRSPAEPLSPPTRRRRGGLFALAREAGSVAAALGLAGLLAAAGIELSRRLEGRPTAAPKSHVAADDPAAGPPRDQPAGDAAVRERERLPTPNRAGEPRVPATAESEPFAPAAAVVSGRPAGSDTPAPAPDPAGEIVRGAPVSWSERQGPPTMLTVPLPAGTRRAVPRSAAFDLAFEMAHGESPFVDPARDAALALDRPPLALGADGFLELLTGGLRRRPAAAGARVRVEEVLAAVPPPPALEAGGGAVRLGLHGVRSGRSSGGVPTVLLEVAAVAVGDDDAGREPLDATLIVDQSAAGDARGWPAICRGLVALAGRLGPADRVSVVLCGPRPRLALRDAEPAAVATAASNWEALPAVAAADLDAALELAAAEGLLGSRTVVVAHAVTLDRGQQVVRKALAAWHGALALAGGEPLSNEAYGGPRFIVIDPATPGPAAEGEPTFGRTALDAAAIRRELLAQVTGRGTLVARQCHLEVRFDPRRVARYRLVGHRQTAVESLAAAPPPTIDLHAGETVRAVYEIVPRDGTAAGLVTATLSWRSPGGDLAAVSATDRESVDGQDGLPSPHGCELLLAAGLGELAAGSPHQPQPRATLAMLERLARDWRARGDVTPFGASLLGLLERRGPDQRPGR